MDPLDEIAEAYVRLALALDVHEPGAVDWYYGPVEWKEEAEKDRPSLEDIQRESSALIERLEVLAGTEPDSARLDRNHFLEGQLGAVRGRAAMVAGTLSGFDVESRTLYDAVLPPLDQGELEEVLAEIDHRLPGDGPLPDRLEIWSARFDVPVEDIDRLLRVAVDECRRRTIAHIELPDSERITLEYVRDVPWGGWAQYKRDYDTRIRINVDRPIPVGWIINLACHEAYPGHHVQFVLMDERMAGQRGWVEYTILPFHSPLSFLQEALAVIGVGLVFPEVKDLAEFGRATLFPLAGLDLSTAEEHFAMLDLLDRLWRLGPEAHAAREYLDGRWDEDRTKTWLRHYTLIPQGVIDDFLANTRVDRSYLIGYSAGRALVERYMESRAGGATPEARWDVLEELLTYPWRPSRLADLEGQSSEAPRETTTAP